jgi:hypothetical protein
MLGDYEGAAKTSQAHQERAMSGTRRTAGSHQGGHEHGKRIGRTEAALAASTVVNQVEATFPAATANPVARVILPLAPLMLLKPERKGVGDPRVLAGVAVVGLAVTRELKSWQTGGDPVAVRIVRSSSVPLLANEKDWFVAEVHDARGRSVDGHSINWSSSDEAVATVDPATGEVTAVGTGTARIGATVNGTMSDFATVFVR